MLKWQYAVVRNDHSAYAGDLASYLEQGYEPFFLTVEAGKRYLHLKRYDLQEAE